MANRNYCDLCHNTFASESGLYNNKKTHSGGKKYDVHSATNNLAKVVI